MSLLIGCLAQARDKRFASVLELARALAPYGEGGQRSAARIERILARSVARGADAAPIEPVPIEPTIRDAASGIDGTVSSWGQTRDTPRRANGVWFVVGAAALTLGGAVLFFSGRGAELEEGAVSAAAATSESSTVAVSQGRAAPVLQEPLPKEGSLLPSPSLDEPQVEHLPQEVTRKASAPRPVVSQETSSPQVSAVKEQSPSVGSGSRVKRGRAGTSANEPPPQTAVSPVPTQFTDFGGRR